VRLKVFAQPLPDNQGEAAQMRFPQWITLLCGAAIAATPAAASETATYTYDTQGRLVKVAHSGTVNNGINTCYTYDKALNRTNVTDAISGGCTSGNGGNAAPTPVNDTGSQGKCTTVVYNVTANDTDPEGDALTVTAVTGNGFTVYSATSVQFTSTAGTGNKVGTYTVTDAGGATANATLTVNVSGGSC